MEALWRMIDQADRRAWLMSRMMGRLGVPVSGASRVGLGVPLRGACRTCLSCRHAEECEAWLSSSNSAYVADAPEFCPNASLFRQLRTSASGSEGL